MNSKLSLRRRNLAPQYANVMEDFDYKLLPGARKQPGKHREPFSVYELQLPFLSFPAPLQKKLKSLSILSRR